MHLRAFPVYKPVPPKNAGFSQACGKFRGLKESKPSNIKDAQMNAISGNAVGLQN
jgi:hypothetical protein